MMLLLVAVGMGTACGDDDGGGNDAGPGSDAVIQGYQCTKNPDLIMTRTECRQDVQCPCGTRCERGLCRHECIADTDCDGWCDFFGDCRDASDLESIPGVTPPSPSQILVTPSFVPVYDWNLETPKLVTLRAPRGALNDVRLVASVGLEVQCEPEADFGPECTVATVAADAQVQVALRVRQLPGAARLSWTLTAHHRNQIEVVGLQKTTPPIVTPLNPGVYEGRILMRSASATLRTDQPLSAVDVETRFSMLGLPASLKLYGDGTLVLSDPAGILPADWVFMLRGDGTFDAVEGQTDRSVRIYLGGATTVEQTTTEVTVSGAGAVRAFDGGLQGTLTMAVGGIGLTYAPATLVDERHRASWSFAMSRTGDIPTGETPPALGAGEEPGFSPIVDRYDDPLPWESETAACFVSDSDFTDTGTGTATGLAGSIQRALCFGHGNALESVQFMPAALANLNASGDLMCEGGAPIIRAMALPFFTYGDRSVQLTPQQQLQNCLADLALVQAGPPSPGGTDAQCLNELSGCGVDGVCTSVEMPRCLDAPLAIRAVALGMSALARQGVPDQIHWTVTDEAGARMGLRVLQQWIQVHTFVAREATQEADQYLGLLDLNELDQGLAQSIAGWDLVLHPRVAGRLMHVPPALLNAPDYRGVNFAPGTMSQEITQAVGIPVVILEGLRAQIEAATQIVLLTRFRGGALPDTLGKTMRYAAVLVPLAQMLHQRAREAGVVGWESQWAESKDRIAMALARYVSQWRALQAGDNPLGIEDKDLPLYRGLTNPDAAGQRFEAISTYIMDNFASDAVTTAAAAKVAADAAWDLLLQRQIQADQQAQVPSRVLEVKRLYGEKLISLCGNPYGLTADQVLDDGVWPELSPQSCFMNPVNPVCAFDEQRLRDQLTQDDVGYQLCIQSRIQFQLGDRARLESDEVNEWIDGINHAIDVRHNQTDLNDYLPETEDEWWEALKAVDPGIAEMVVEYAVCTRDSTCLWNDLFVLEHYEDPGTDDHNAFVSAAHACKAIFGGRKLISEMVNEDPALDMPDCYQGSLGELVLSARSAAKDVQVAGSALEDYTSQYRAAMWTCTFDDAALEMSETVTDQLDELEEYFTTYTSQLQGGIDLIRGVVSAVPAIIGFFTGDGDSRKEVLNSTFDLVAGGVVSGMDEYSGINQIKTLHADFLADWEDQIADAKCFHDAEIHLIGAETQARRGEKSKLDLALSMVKIRNAKAEVARLIKEGTSRVNRVANQSRMSLFHDLWNDLWTGTESDHKGKVEAYRRKMRLAQRMLYLAVRAVEYELQVTRFSLRQGVLAARTPGELDQLVTQLNAIIGAGNIGGQSPGNRHVELSLKENLLQLSDRSDLADGLNTMTDTERFRAMLMSKRYAHFNANNEYDGQLIPFSVAPLGTIGTECAERHWSVAVSLQGTDLTDDNTTYLQMGLLQKNDFYSQWCLTPDQEQGEMQLASVRPARNLFQDPVWGGDYGVANPTDSAYVIALVDAYFNVPWEEFTQATYTDGSDTALACRAIYGEYAIFIPAQIISMEGSSGLMLRNVDDIWLRFDYVSAAKQWQ